VQNCREKNKKYTDTPIEKILNNQFESVKQVAKSN
jgi:hypothetical protein